MQPELSEPVPERLLRAARTAPAGTAVVTPMAARKKSEVRGRLPRWSALAASFAFGAVGAALWLQFANDGALDLQHGRLSARGELARALTNQLGSDSAAPTQVGMSFQDKQGRYCRTFTLRDRGAIAGLACRDANGWNVEAIAPLAVSEQNNGGLRMAASPMPKAILQAIDERIAGEALGAEAEKEARSRGWRQ
jgi:hypothetical protein